MREDKYFTILDENHCMFRDSCEKFGTEECTWQCKKMDDMNYLLSLSELPKKYKRPYTLQLSYVENENTSKYLRHLVNDIEYFVNKGYNAYFYGDIGTGKTSWAIGCLRSYFTAISGKSGHVVRGLFINVPKFLRDIKYYMTHKNENFAELVESIKTANLVIWDDIFQTDPTAFESQWLYSFINDRIMDELSNIYTSNVSPEQLQLLDTRLHSRVCVASDCLEFTCSDMRGHNQFSAEIDVWENEVEFENIGANNDNA